MLWQSEGRGRVLCVVCCVLTLVTFVRLISLSMAPQEQNKINKTFSTLRLKGKNILERVVGRQRQVSASHVQKRLTMEQCTLYGATKKKKQTHVPH